MRISVLFGGESEERAVSIASASQIIPALRSRGHEVLAVDAAHGAIAAEDEPRVLTADVDVVPPSAAELESVRTAGSSLRLPAAVGDSDLVFIALHGGSGEDGRLQALLDLAGLRYTGSGPLASGMTMDKDVSKTIARAAGVRTPDWMLAPASSAEVAERLGLPVVVKPTAQGSTVGLSIVREPEGLGPAIERAGEFGTVMIEAFISGRELTVGVLDGRALAPGEILLPAEDAFSYEAKYQRGAVTEQFPAVLPDAVSAAVRLASEAAHRALRLEGYSRSDFRLDSEDRLWFIETNSLPGMTGTSLMPQSAAAASIDYAELCDRICRIAMRDR